MLHKNALQLIILLIICSYTFGRTSKSLRITLPNSSKLIGRFMRSSNGNGIRAFLGIPYAEAPVGNLRFRPPVPKAPWTEERKAIKDGSQCTQLNLFFRENINQIVGSEDCLYLNVFTPSRLPKIPLSVIVLIHGGGFECGESSSYIWGPEYLLNHDIIYVSLNYRLGPLGFLSTEQKDCPGNMGLKDQTMALRWIQQNIAAFGGDPNSVTLFGESAGGASITYHMMSPLSKGLFHRAISQSGTNLSPWSQPAYPGVATERAIALAESFQCYQNITEWSTILDCLREKDAYEITKFFYKLFKWDFDPMVPYPPVVEPDLPGAFITKLPRDLWNVHGNSIPWMSGITTEEGALKTAAFINDSSLLNYFNANFGLALSVSFNYDHYPIEVQQEITRQINEFYFNGKQLNADNFDNFTNLYSDGWFNAGFDEYLKIRFAGQNFSENVAPTFVYLFAHKGGSSLTEYFGGDKETFYGVSHSDDLQYMFSMSTNTFSNAIPTDDDELMFKIVTQLWVNFAQTGNPTAPSFNDTEDLAKVYQSWLPATGYPLNYYRIGKRDDSDLNLLDMENGLYEERMKFWEQLPIT